MINLVCSIVIISCCGLLGFMIANNYGLRVNQIRYIQNGLQMLETEITYGLTPLPKALKRVGSRLPDPANQLFVHTGEALSEKNISVAEAWQESLTYLKKHSALMNEELDVLFYFGQVLGSSDVDEQNKSMKLVQEQLKGVFQDAELARGKNQKMWRYLGLGFGAIISLVLI